MGRPFTYGEDQAILSFGMSFSHLYGERAFARAPWRGLAERLDRPAWEVRRRAKVLRELHRGR